MELARVPSGMSVFRWRARRVYGASLEAYPQACSAKPPTPVFGWARMSSSRTSPSCTPHPPKGHTETPALL